MCRKLRANTILEDYTIESEASERLAPPGAVR
jgi:phosphoribosylformylglycinamidine (FGAM) synthase PurS component